MSEFISTQFSVCSGRQRMARHEYLQDVLFFQRRLEKTVQGSGTRKSHYFIVHVWRKWELDHFKVIFLMSCRKSRLQVETRALEQVQFWLKLPSRSRNCSFIMSFRNVWNFQQQEAGGCADMSLITRVNLMGWGNKLAFFAKTLLWVAVLTVQQRENTH